MEFKIASHLSKIVKSRSFVLHRAKLHIILNAKVLGVFFIKIGKLPQNSPYRK
jgi:hypothetical protein